MADRETIAEEMTRLESSLGGVGQVAAAFDAELRRMQESLVFTGREVGQLSQGLGGGLRRAFDGLVFDGIKLSDALRQVARSMIDTVYSTAMRPVQGALGGTLAQGVNAMMSGILPFAQGGGFAAGRVQPFAQGGVVGSPMLFPMRGATLGLMGEAGPEAILPLSRGADGRLGVSAGGAGRPMQVVVNITTPDVEGFRRSQSQIAAQMGRLLGRGQRNG